MGLLGAVILSVKIKLVPTPEQAQSLLTTLETINHASNRVSQLAWDFKIFHKFDFQKAFYRQIRNEF